LCRLSDQIDIADVIQPCNLTVNDRQIFMAAPATLTDPGMQEVVLEFAQCVADHSGGELLSMKSIYFEILDVDMEDYIGGVTDYLRRVETLHKALTLYLWLSYRFAGVFKSQALAFHAKSLVEDRIDQCLNAVHWDSGKKERMRKAKLREKALLDEQRRFSGERLGEIEEDSGEQNQSTEGDDEDEDSAALDGEDSHSEESEETEILDEFQRPELQSDFSNEAGREDIPATSTSNERNLPVDEAARAVEDGRLWDKVSQKNHESAGP
jgi:ATP-dependent RNA helicase SUPV3L1/SUV3